MTWVMKVPGHEPVSELQFTLDDLDAIEAESGIGWLVANPAGSSKVLRAYLKVAYRHLGKDPSEVDSLTQGDLHGVLDFIPDKDVEERPTKAARKSRKHRSSSDTSQSATTGPLRSVEPNAS